MIWHRIEVAGSLIDFGQDLESITYTDKRGLEADDVEIVVIDADGRYELPSTGVTINVSFGDDLEAVEVLAVVDEVSHDGPPDKITIRGRAANLRAEFLAVRSQSFDDTTLGAILEQIAARHSVTLAISEELTNLPVEHIDQQYESDANFVTRLAEDYGAIASVKHGRLVFAVAGAAQSVSGDPLESILISRSDTISHNYQSADRTGEVSGVEANWQDTGAAEVKTVLAGEAGNTRSIKRVYNTESAAKQAAEAELVRARRGSKSLTLNLTRLHGGVLAETPVQVLGFKPEIDAVGWVVTEATHSYGASGCLSNIGLEVATL